MNTKRLGRPPSGAPREPSRTVRMNDERWQFFKLKLGSAWLRTQIDAAMAAHTNTKDTDQ